MLRRTSALLVGVLRRTSALLVGALASLLGVVLVASPAGAELAGAARHPGVHVSGFQSSGSTIVTVPTGIPLFIGVGAPSRPMNLRSAGDLPSGVSPTMRAAVTQFFEQSGSLDDGAWIVGTAAATGASIAATVSDPATIAVGSPTFGVPDLYVAPDLASLAGDEWTSAVVAMGRAAARNRAVALVDAPQATVRAAMASPANATSLVALASQVRTALGGDARSVFLLGSGVVSGGQVLGAAAPYSGLLARNDRNEGVWQSAANVPFSGLDAQWSPTGTLAGMLNVSGIAILRSFPSRGSLVWSERTVAGLSANAYLNNVRTVDTMQRSIAEGLQGYVFYANDATTWAAITSSIDSYLQGWWSEGALFGWNARTAYTVQCGIGTSMTAQDILNGFLHVDVTARLSSSGLPPVSWTQSLQMQTD